MKIAIIAHCLHPIKEPFEGGLEMMTFLLCRSLMQRGHEVHLFGHRDSDSSFDIYPIPTDKLYPSRLLTEMKTQGQDDNSVREMLAYNFVMNQIASGDYDIVHNHSLHYLPIMMGNLLGIPMLTSIHTPRFPYLQLGAAGVRDNLRQTFTMVSASLARTWSHMIPSATVVYNGIDLSKWKYTANPTGDYLFWYGRICPEKGTDLAVQIALRAEKKIVLAGPISNRAYFEDKVAPLLKNTQVEYVGHRSQGELVSLLGNARGLLFTSTWEEPYGLTLAESLACGTPVFAFEGGATGEILTEQAGRITPKNNIEAMVEVVNQLDCIDRKACRARAESFCSHEVMVEAYLDIYDRLLEHRDYKMQVLP